MVDMTQQQTLFCAETPAIPLRAVHLDLKGLPPSPARLVDLVQVFKAARFNAVIVEWEDMFPWQFDQEVRSPSTYDESTVKAFDAAAQLAGIEIIPLVQCLGHMESVLALNKYAHLRELPQRADVLNVLAPGARELVQAMIDDVLALLPSTKRFHLGGDEAWVFGCHPDTQAYCNQHDRPTLFWRHVEPLVDHLQRQKVRPMLWHDMVYNWSSDWLNRLAPYVDLVVWGYQQRPDRTNDNYHVSHIERLIDHGITVWGGTAYKGADGADAELPDIPARIANAQGWVENAASVGLVGIVATGWSRYSTHRFQCEPIESSLDALVVVGHLLHDGHMPETPWHDAVMNHLQQEPTANCYLTCHQAVRELSEACNAAWTRIRHLHMQLALEAHDPQRREQWIKVWFYQQIDQAHTNLTRAGEQFKAAFAGLVDPRAMESYVQERVGPVKAQQQALRTALHAQHITEAELAEVQR